MAFDHRRFFEHFFEPEAGETEAALLDIERYLEVKLPEALALLYRLTPIRHTGALSLRPLDDLEIDDSVLYFGQVAHTNARVGVAVEQLAAPNPHVVNTADTTLNEWFSAFILTARIVAMPSFASTAQPSAPAWVRFDFPGLGLQLWTAGGVVSDGKRIGAKREGDLEAWR